MNKPKGCFAWGIWQNVTALQVKGWCSFKSAAKGKRYHSKEQYIRPNDRCLSTKALFTCANVPTTVVHYLQEQCFKPGN